MDGDSDSGLLNSAIELAHDCWDEECDGQIAVTLAQFVVNYFAQCSECRKPVVYGGSGETHTQVLERLIIGGLERRGWTVVPSR